MVFIGRRCFYCFPLDEFFYAKVAGVSLTLSMLSMGAFFTALLEPLFFDRKIIYYELIFGALAIIGLLLIFQSEWSQWLGILMALLSTILGVFFTLVNGKLANHVPAAAVSFYELGFGALLTWCVVAFNPKFFGQAIDLWVPRCDIVGSAELGVYGLCLCRFCSCNENPFSLFGYDFNQYGTHLWNCPIGHHFR